MPNDETPENPSPRDQFYLRVLTREEQAAHDQAADAMRLACNPNPLARIFAAQEYYQNRALNVLAAPPVTHESCRCGQTAIRDTRPHCHCTGSYIVCDSCDTTVEDIHYCNSCSIRYLRPCYVDECSNYRDTRVSDRCLSHRITHDICAICYEYHLRTELTPQYEGSDDFLCRSCLQQHYIQCDNCNDLVHRNISYNYEDSDLCETCYSDRRSEEIDAEDDNTDCYTLASHCVKLEESGRHAILDYHPDIEWNFFKKESEDSPFFGIELEIEHTCDADQHVNAKYLGGALNSRCLISYDGSLSSEGFELVLTPHTREAFDELPWKTILSTLSSNGGRSYDAESSCGLHIHIEKSAFQGRQVHYKHLFDALRERLTDFSKRTPNQIESYCRFKTTTYERYAAVNLNSEKTVEIRLWRGTLNYERFIASIDINFALLDFMHDKTDMDNFKNNECLEVNLWSRFLTYIASKPKYHFLHNYLTIGETENVRDSLQAE